MKTIDLRIGELRSLGEQFWMLARAIVGILRDKKESLKDFYKMQRYYGLFTRITHKVEQGNILGEWMSPRLRVLPPALESKLRRIEELRKSKEHLFAEPPSFMFVSDALPLFDKTSADYRLYYILKILLYNRCQIKFFYSKKSRDDLRYIKAFKGKIEFKHVPMLREEYCKILSEGRSDYVWITNLWRIEYVRCMADVVICLRSRNPVSKIVVDTMDFHSKEFLRKFQWTNNEDDLVLSNEFLKNEKLLYSAADIVVTVSAKESQDITEQITGIKRVEIVPNIHEIHLPVRPFVERKHICFMGNFGTKHNVDAVKYFIQTIFPSILNRNPEIEFHVLGYGSERYKNTLETANVRVIGGMKSLHKALTHYKLFVCPMIYGAGIKGKIGDAIVAGIPIVTTSIGAEGFPWRDGIECYIADCPEEFSEKSNHCLHDTDVWNSFSVNAMLMLAENYSPGVVSAKLRDMLL